MMAIVLHYAETGIMAAPPRASAHYAPAQAWLEARKIKLAHPRDRVTVTQGGRETEVAA